MKTKERLERENVTRLKQLARQLGLKGYSRLKKQDLIDRITADNQPLEDINAALDALNVKVSWWTRMTKEQVGLYGSIASIVGIIITLSIFFWQESRHTITIDSKEVLELLLKEKYINPAQREQVEKKIKALETALNDEKSGNSKERREALKAFEKGDLSKAQELFKTLINTADKKQAENYYNLGLAYYLGAKYKKALSVYLEAEKLDPENAIYLNDLGLIYNILGEPKKALDYHKKALELFKRNYGPSHPFVATSWSHIGSTWDKLGEYKKAIGYFEKAVEVQLQTHGPFHSDVATSWSNIGTAWDKLGEYKKALECVQKALTIYNKYFGPNHPKTKNAKNGFEYLQSKLKAKK